MSIKTSSSFRFLLAIIALILPSKSYSQKEKTTTIIFKYIKDSYMVDSFAFPIDKPLNGWSFEPSDRFPQKIISFTQMGDTCVTTCEYSIKDTTCATLGDLYGHEIVVIPGDHITINIGPRNHNKLAGKYFKEWAHDVTYSGKNKYIYGLFDSLSNLEGDLRLGSSERLSKTDSTLSPFCHAVKERYVRRLNFVNDYFKEYLIPVNIQKMVLSEIYCSYLLNLTIPLNSVKFNLDSYPKEFADLIKNNKFNDKNLYFKTNQYQLLAYQFSKTNNETSSRPPFSSQSLVSIYKFIKKNNKGKIRDHQITVHLDQYITQYHSFSKQIDSLYTDFKGYCTTQNYIAFLDSDIVINRNEKIPVYTLDQAMSSEIKDSTNTKRTLKSLLNKKPVLVICWASWCKPCLYEMPYESVLEKEYGDKVDFIYLSFDNNQSEWISKSKEMKVNNNNYRIINNFKSPMAMFYHMSSIPQYFIYDRQGKQVDNKFRPSDKEFRSALDGLLK
ncbi:TlpA disulfide reductase family protein [Pedobacter sp. L105]|uniref:TlpA family protein disulfide reductase n=1 Tax=Pedobacter sp. L105 TaxID=1641871 RepID=UPI00131CB443|nr:TlpA disulfide reductase family protein [Pedobacter sp. L105]